MPTCAASVSGSPPSGAKTWSFRYQRQSDRRKRNVTLGAYPDYSLDAARKWATELRAAVARGENPAGGKQARKRAETFLEVCAQWAWRHARKKNRKSGRRKVTPLGLKRSIRMLRRHVLPLQLESDAPVWRSPASRSKNKREHTIPLSPLAVRLIAEARRLAGEDPWLSPNARGDGPMDSGALSISLASAACACTTCPRP